MEALVKLLIEKYHVPPDEAEAYAQDILAGSAGTSVRGVQPGGHGDALRSEALKTIADDTLAGIWDMNNFVETAIQGGHSDFPSIKRAYDEKIARSAANTREEAARAAEDRKAIGRGAQAKDMVAQRVAEAVTQNEITRLAHMLDFSQGIKPIPGGGFTQQHRTPTDMRAPLQEAPTTIIPVQKPMPRIELGEVTVEPLVRPDPYEDKLRKMAAFRKAALGY